MSATGPVVAVGEQDPFPEDLGPRAVCGRRGCRCARSGAARQGCRRSGWWGQDLADPAGLAAAAVTGSPHAAFHRRSKVTASTVSLSDNPCSACNVITAAITSAGTDGRPRPDGNKSSNNASGNN